MPAHLDLTAEEPGATGEGCEQGYSASDDSDGVAPMGFESSNELKQTGRASWDQGPKYFGLGLTALDVLEAKAAAQCGRGSLDAGCDALSALGQEQMQQDIQHLLQERLRELDTDAMVLRSKAAFAAAAAAPLPQAAAAPLPQAAVAAAAAAAGSSSQVGTQKSRRAVQQVCRRSAAVSYCSSSKAAGGYGGSGPANKWCSSPLPGIPSSLRVASLMPNMGTPATIRFNALKKVDRTYNLLKNSRAIQMHKRKLQKSDDAQREGSEEGRVEGNWQWHQIQVGRHVSCDIIMLSLIVGQTLPYCYLRTACNIIQFGKVVAWTNNVGWGPLQQ